MHPGDADNMIPSGDHLSGSRGHMGIHGRHGSSGWRSNNGLFRFPMARGGGQAPAEPSGCPQIAPLALGSQLNINFPSQIFPPPARSAFPPSTASTSTSSFSNTSGIPSYLVALPRRLPSLRSSGEFSAPPQPSPVQSRYSPSISSSSGTPSPLEVSLNIGNSIHVWSDNTRFIRKATMRGFVQYLLLHPEGEP